MSTKLFIGNLAYSVNSGDLEESFSKYGTVDSVAIMTDRDSGRSRGFGFIEMSNEQGANDAIKALNGSPLAGRDLVVNIAKPKTERPSGDGNGSRRSFG